MRNFHRKKPCGFRCARSALHRHRRPKPLSVRSVRHSVERESKQPDLRTIHPNREKLRDLRRIARSGRNPRIYDLFDVYNPKYKTCDRSYCSDDWHIYHDAQYDWVDRISGDCRPGWGKDVPARFRRGENRKLRTRQTSALDKAVAEGNWDDFLLPLNRRNICWLYG